MNDAEWTQTHAGDSYPSGHLVGTQKSWEKYRDAVVTYGARSHQANHALHAAIDTGWTMEGISQMITTSGSVSSFPSWPSRGQGTGRRGTGGGLKGPNSPPVDQ